MESGSVRQGEAATAAVAAGDTVPAPRRHHRAWIVAGALIAAAAAYYVLFLTFAYTEDAYVWSDLVTVASQVAGPIQSVAVRYNQKVEAGDLIATIDPRPYQLDVALRERQVADLEAAVAVRQGANAVDAARADTAKAGLIYAQAEFDRIAALVRDQTVSRADLDKSTDDLRTAKDRLADRQAQSLVTARQVGAAETAVAVARADLSVAQYNLSRTRLTAPAAGYVNNLTLRPGDYAKVGEALVGIVDASRWRIVANFKEDVAARLEPGHRVWIWLDSDPWHLRRGTVEGVERGIARRPGTTELLPYVAPTTEWIRLRRRLPVTILLAPPVSTRLFMGADARVFLVR